MDNYHSVIHQMEAFGIELMDKDLPLVIPTPKRKTCGRKGKYWYWLQLWRPRHPDGRETGAEYVVGRFGTYKHGGSDRKVELDVQPLTEAERDRWKAERRAAEERARAAKEEAAAAAALTAGEIWRRARADGVSIYLQRKGVQAEACKFLHEWVELRRSNPADKPIRLPPGTLMLPLLRYDWPRETALRGLQFIKPDGFKIFTEGFAKTGASLRLGQVDASTSVLMICEGYATGLSIRMATGRRWPVFVALDAYNLVWVVEILRALFPDVHILICADDDWKSTDHDGPNPGRRKALTAARTTPACDIVTPVFDTDLRQLKDTDFNDLHMRQGIEVVERQLLRALDAIEKGVGRRGA